MIRKCVALSLSAILFLTGCSQTPLPVVTPPATITPTTASAAIKHVVVIFGENISFDHYFGTYPNAANLPGETTFTAATGTPASANYIATPSLLTANPNLNSANLNAGTNSIPANPFRLAPGQAATGDQGHNYTPEQTAFDNGKLDLFPLSVGTANGATLTAETNGAAITNTTALTMGYYDGNTVTALWNYAQHYAMNDHSFGTTFGPSTPGAINLISGQTNGVITPFNAASAIVADGNGGFTDINDADPTGDICSTTTGASFAMSGKNVGDLLTAAKVSWGFFEGGFDLSVSNANGTTGCGRTTGAVNIPGHPLKADYIPHHQPFQYYATTANLAHTRPTSVAAIGANGDGANHQYDMHDFTDALAAGNLPAVSFLKASGFQDAHAGYSDPLDEQTFVVSTINAIEKSSFWSSTAIIIAYDDSDGWYDHLSNVINGSNTSVDTLNGVGTNLCLTATAAGNALPGVLPATVHAQGRCGYGPRLPLMVISPWAKKNSVDSTVTDQSSITRFIEDVFLSSQRIGGGSFDAIAGPLTNMFDFSNGATPPNSNIVVLDPITGKVTSGN